MATASAIIAGRYAVRRLLGTGAQGEVYEAHDTHEDDIVAVKLLTGVHPGIAWDEARILRRLADPHILPIRNADLSLGVPYLVTELAPQGSVDQALRSAGSRGLDTDDVVRWIRQACHGVARAHALGLLHNDLKPANLFLNAEGECLVADFGFASLLPPGSSSVSPHGATAETAAPEVAAAWGTPAASASVASDVYSLGATSFWMLAAVPPKDLSGAFDTQARMARSATATPPRLRDVAPHVSQHVATVIERAMRPDPSARFADVTALAAALGSRPTVSVRWRRTDEHAGHLACWRGERSAPAGPYVVCMEPAPRVTQRVITTTLATSGRRVRGACRTCPTRSWPRAIRSVMRDLG